LPLRCLLFHDVIDDASADADITRQVSLLIALSCHRSGMALLRCRHADIAAIRASHSALMARYTRCCCYFCGVITR